jgi:thiol-disulfide isomerase/thioredoxin
MNKQLFKEAIKRKEKLILFFNASWCPACKEISHVVEQIKTSRPDYKFYDLKADMDGVEELEEIFDVDYLPSLVIISETGYKEYSGSRQIKKLLR